MAYVKLFNKTDRNDVIRAFIKKADSVTDTNYSNALNSQNNCMIARGSALTANCTLLNLQLQL